MWHPCPVAHRPCLISLNGSGFDPMTGEALWRVKHSWAALRREGGEKRNIKKSNIYCAPPLQIGKLRPGVHWLVPKHWTCWWYINFLTLNLSVLSPYRTSQSSSHSPMAWQYLPCKLFELLNPGWPSLRGAEPLCWWPFFLAITAPWFHVDNISKGKEDAELEFICRPSRATPCHVWLFKFILKWNKI